MQFDERAADIREGDLRGRAEPGERGRVDQEPSTLSAIS